MCVGMYSGVTSVFLHITNYSDHIMIDNTPVRYMHAESGSFSHNNSVYGGKHVKYGVAQLSVGADEDRYSIILDHKTDKVANLSSFGVFDGHNGVSKCL